MTEQTHNFEADTGKILNIVINSLYSDRDIFLRELLSNASDAIHKRKLLGQTQPDILNSAEDEILVAVDDKKKTVEIIDTGIGLNADDLTETLGTIARSGTSSFLDSIEEASDSKNAAKSLIGKFGVGFYSAFMVAEKVVVTTRKAGENGANTWESDGKAGYTITAVSDEHPVGTSIKLFLRKDAKEYADLHKLKGLIKKYSDHIIVPIFVQSKDVEKEQANSAQALWTKSPSEVSEEEYSEFYKASLGAFDEPYITLHNKTEGSIDFTNLLYIPKTAPFDLFEPERKTKISLYINRVFISQDVDGVIPTWLRFVKGILDTTSLDLNVSREMVQNSPVIKKISKSVTKRILSELKKKLKKDEAGYDTFWEQFGKVLKEGLYEDYEYRDKIAEITRAYSLKHQKLISLDAYLEEMADKQDKIYYLTADTLKQAKTSPHLEGFKAKDIDVLLMTDPIDAFWMSQMGAYKEKSFLSISRDKYDLSELSEETPNEAANEAETNSLALLIKDCLGDAVEDVKVTTSLVESPVRLVAGEGGLDFNLERILKAQNPEFEGSKKTLEVNAEHSLVRKIPDLSPELQKALSRVLFEQARVLDGEMPSDPQQFSKDLIAIGTAL
ncbi:molecular chaperone HtpG [Lentibacter algarum]|jgi:molecular chaperone HtpG|uniref:Chaperone protein HtpG n=1 Tax=Lentibacter algarum TaxID=576131 RepID=A0A1H3HYC6_9RHOB|nr:molecular chaperone HtpG [Lentibacter algarum]WIF31200.1 High temperature protein G [Lentibacter algarum]SDY20437.1 molecular chaperone HtpG [Lentibacter algarum]